MVPNSVVLNSAVVPLREPDRSTCARACGRRHPERAAGAARGVDHRRRCATRRGSRSRSSTATRSSCASPPRRARGRRAGAGDRGARGSSRARRARSGDAVAQEQLRAVLGGSSSSSSCAAESSSAPATIRSSRSRRPDGPGQHRGEGQEEHRPARPLGEQVTGEVRASPQSTSRTSTALREPAERRAQVERAAASQRSVVDMRSGGGQLGLRGVSASRRALRARAAAGDVGVE